MGFVLLAAAVVAGTCAVLAALLLVAERYLANYGECRIDINDGGREITVQGGQSLLQSLMSEGIFIPSACGGRGTCAYCKLKVLGGGGPHAPVEMTLLTEDEAKADVRLSCQVKVREDIRVEIPEELFNIREYRGVVESITDLTHDIKYLRIRLIEPERIDFASGQYIQLQAPAYGDSPEPVYRAYSMSNTPSDNRHVETIIRLVPGGICTTWVFTMLKEGDEVTLNGPYGDFHLSDMDRDMVWIAGGSGMAPFWSMVRDMRERGIHRKCRFFFGALRKRDLFLVDELRKIADDLPNFEFIPALSAPADDDDWSGETGLITEICDRHIQSDSEAEAYLCGSPGMIDAAVKTLKAKGIPEDRIHFDKFA